MSRRPVWPGRNFRRCAVESMGLWGFPFVRLKKARLGPIKGQTLRGRIVECPREAVIPLPSPEGVRILGAALRFREQARFPVLRNA